MKRLIIFLLVGLSAIGYGQTIKTIHPVTWTGGVKTVAGVAAANVKTVAGVGVPSSFTGLLDEVPNAGIAFGVRRMNSAYTGPLIRIVRASDSGETDIGAIGEGLDVASISSYCSGTTCYVGKAYDQSGNGYDAIGNGYPTQTNLPIIYIGGAVVTLNGKPAMQITHPRTFQFTISAASLNDFVTTGTKETTAHMVGLQGSGSSSPYKIIMEDEETVGDEYVWFYESGGSERIDFVSYSSAMGGTFTDDTQICMNWQVDGNPLTAYENGSSIGSGTVGASTSSSNTGVIFNIGGLGFSSRNIEGYIQEVIIWPTAESISTIFTNCDTYYSIP